MKCDKVQTLHDPYLDSELDARTTLQIELHLAACPACNRLFATEEKLEAQLTADLNRGPRKAALWEQIEREVPPRHLPPDCNPQRTSHSL